ncbi:MAG: acyltransferase [Haliea sp.]|nr:acyltransferase [Haliea sp.]
MLAWLVLYGHSFAIHKSSGIRDPLRQIFHGSTYIGDIAVYGFFAISGFLVAASLIKRGLIDYILSRVLRIFPALIFCVLATIFLLGPAFTTLSLSDYFAHPDTWSYLGNALAFLQMQWVLPGVFEGNDRPAVNGSLWTLTVEVRCYLALAALTFVGFRLNKLVGSALMLLIFTVGVMSFESIPLLGVHPTWARPALYFILGVFLYLNRDRVILDYRIALLAVGLAFLCFGQEWFNYVFPPALIYLIFYLAYATKTIRTDAVIGDISYGIYIYAFPIQQAVAYCFPAQSPYFNTAISSLIVIPLAWLSWNCIEKPVLGYKRVLLGHADWEKLLASVKALFKGRLSHLP